MHDIRLEKVTKRFGNGLVAVDKADLEVGSGEVMRLLGPSGCGKTTMLRMIAGLEWATSGDIMIGNRRVNDLPARERNVAMAFQFYALYPSLSVEENLAYPLHAEKLSKAEIAQRVARVSEALDLTSILKRRPHQLGEGEKQRVAVGRSIIRDPTCFLFDEPLSRLDIQLRQTMRTQIKEILSKLDKPTVIVTHDQIEALTMADRIAVMQEGRIEQIASPHELFSMPTNLFVAGFIGTPQMNLLEATLVEVGQKDSARRVIARFALLGEIISASVSSGVAISSRETKSPWGFALAVSNSLTSARPTPCTRTSTSPNPWALKRSLISSRKAPTCAVSCRAKSAWRRAIGRVSGANQANFMCSTGPATL